MNTITSISSLVLVSSPPAGSRNIKFGSAVVGPGGRWVPCASVTVEGSFLPSVYEVGSGRKQVCLANRPLSCADEALSRAIKLAAIAAA